MFVLLQNPKKLLFDVATGVFRLYNTSTDSLILSVSGDYHMQTTETNGGTLFWQDGFNMHGQGVEKDVTAPGVPTGLSQTAGDAKVTLSWTDPGDTDLYVIRIKRSTTTGSGYTLVDTVLPGVQTYVDTDVTNDTTYYYVITAIDSNYNESSATSEVSSTPVAADTTPPGLPTSVVATPGDTQVVITWTDPTDTDLAGIRIKRSTTSGSGYSLLTTINPAVETYTDSTAANGITYYYILTAIDAVPNESSATTEVSAIPVAPDTTAPALPTSVIATPGNGQVVITWIDPGDSDLAGIRVKRSTTSGSGYSTLYTVNPAVQTYTDSSASNGTTYYYVLSAIDEIPNESSNTSEVSATPNAPIEFDASSASGTSVSQASFSWTHTPVGTPRGVVVFTMVYASATNIISGVTYGGTSMTEVTSSFAADTSAELGSVKAYFLGSSVPTGAQTVVVTRTNNTNSAYGVAATVTGSTDTTYAGVITEAQNQALTEENVDDGSPGVDSIRFAALYSGLSAVPSVGSNSTAMESNDIGARVFATCRETTGGQGSRPVGFTAASDDVAAVYLAITKA